MRQNEISENLSEFTYHKKDYDIDTSLYNRVLNALKKIDIPYKPTVQKMHGPAIEGNYKVTGDTRVILIIEHEDDRIQWACSKLISMDSGEPETLKEATTMPNGHLW